MKNKISAKWALIGLLLGAITPAMAHKINLFVSIEGDQAEVMGYFADGKTPQQAPITVFDMDDEPLLKGQTNDDGEFVFTLPKREPLKVVIDAGLGHKAEYVIPEEDLLEETDVMIQSVEEVSAGSEGAVNAKTQDMTSSPAVGNSVELQKMIEKAVAKANRPLMLKLDQAQKKAKLSDILGGIGLIFGALGLWFFLQARKLKEQTTDRPQP